VSEAAVQQTEESPQTRRDAPDEASGSVLSPLRGFLVLLAVLVAAGVLIVVTKSDDDPPPVTNTAPATTDFSLTDEEAVARFGELNALAWQSALERDQSLLSGIFTESGPTGTRAAKAIRGLLHDDVIDRSRSKTLSVQVVLNEPEEIQLREISRLHPCFETEEGKDVTDAPEIVQRTILWTLKQEQRVWRIHDGILEKQRALERQRASCG